MISKISLRAAVALAALALTTPALAQQAAKQEPRFGVGVGLTGSQLTLVKKAEAADPAAAPSAPVVRRTVCSHCSVGCAVDAVVEWQIRAWWSQLFVPKNDTNLRSR